ncbi:hypothetical protein AAKU55_003169 [Oxalobacteraceae bacterium GrIS 1.11]
MSILKLPYAAKMAYGEGRLAANDWLDRSTITTLPTITAAKFRRMAEAKYVKSTAHRSNQAALLAEWNRGYDSNLAIAVAYDAAPELDKDAARADLIAEVAAKAGAVAALMSVMQVLPAADRQAALTTCLTMTGDVGRDLAGLVGDAT